MGAYLEFDVRFSDPEVVLGKIFEIGFSDGGETCDIK